jgi:hypothetical protein
MVTSGLSAAACAIVFAADAAHPENSWTQIGHALGEMHGRDDTVFDDEHTHHLPLRQWYEKLDRMTRQILSSFNARTNLLR